MHAGRGSKGVVVSLVALCIAFVVSTRALADRPHSNPGGTAYRAAILHFLDNPTVSANAYEYFEDGLLIVNQEGRVEQVGNAEDLIQQLQPQRIVDYRGYLLLPGFIDTHIHYPQTEMIASFGEQLLEWLNRYTFPTEGQFGDASYAAQVADFFLDQLLKNGTTTALVFATVHKASVDAFFSAAQKRNLRMIAGKVLMDRNAPEYLLDTPETAYADSKELITRWHKRGRLLYAVTPRFAITSTPEELQAAGRLLGEFPDVYMHTHLSENQDEVAFVLSLFPEAANYTDVYNQFGLVRSRAIFAHGIYLDDSEYEVLAQNGAAIAFCPTSNLFLGSGLFRLYKAEAFGVLVGLGTDIGAGTSFSALQTMNEAYKVVQLQKVFDSDPSQVKPLSTLKAFYLATLGGARALYLENSLGNFLPGKEADFVVLNPRATDLMDFRLQKVQSLEELLFAVQILGDDRAVVQTYIMGKPALPKKEKQP
jgi:guanine deaminase